MGRDNEAPPPSPTPPPGLAVDASDACTRPRQMRLRLRLLLIPHVDRPGRSHRNMELFPDVAVSDVRPSFCRGSVLCAFSRSASLTWNGRGLLGRACQSTFFRVRASCGLMVLVIICARSGFKSPSHHLHHHLTGTRGGAGRLCRPAVL